MKHIKTFKLNESNLDKDKIIFIEFFKEIIIDNVDVSENNIIEVNKDFIEIEIEPYEDFEEHIILITSDENNRKINNNFRFELQPTFLGTVKLIPHYRDDIDDNALFLFDLDLLEGDFKNFISGIECQLDLTLEDNRIYDWNYPIVWSRFFSIEELEFWMTVHGILDESLESIISVWLTNNYFLFEYKIDINDVNKNLNEWAYLNKIDLTNKSQFNRYKYKKLY
jgi:hypothetical protein